jgi:hypothetical protein
MNNRLKQLEFHRDAKIAENRDDDETVLEFRRSFREQFKEFVGEHSQSNTEDFAEKSLKEVWTLVNELESKRAYREMTEKSFRASPLTKTNQKTKTE